MAMKRKSQFSEFSGVLPSHMKPDFWEVYARHVIDYVKPGCFPDLTNLDQPDLQSLASDTGIEVTTAIPESNLEAESRYVQLVPGMSANE